ncbi:MAG TPA: hypothetical protein PKE29_01100 [Phycisphaerales bacterium]|nr:hypothetical protein [Phycisphaerales bacterium]
MNTHARRVALTLAAALCLIAAGCEESKVTDANFAKITKGMTISQVQSILGSGKDETSSAGYTISGGGVLGSQAAPEKVYTWKSKDLQIIVTMKDGKVVQMEKRPI